MAIMYCIAGSYHFIKPKVYLRIMPRYLPHPSLLVYLSGLTEIALGIGICIPVLKNYAIFGLIGMLSAFLLLHVYMLSGEKAGAGIPKWLLLLRLPLQFALMYWAYSYLSL